MSNKIQYDSFVMRQFKTSFIGTNLAKVNQDALLELLNKAYVHSSSVMASNNGVYLKDSKSDFCKYLVMRNNLGIKQQVMKITTDVYPFIRTGYSSRNDKELSVLSRWLELPKEFDLPDAEYIVAVLYSKEQLFSEFLKTADIKPGSPDKFKLTDDCEYGIVAILGTPEAYPDPMVPITMMRNALGMKEGGNGVPIDKDEYQKSVDFWSKNILVKN